MERYSNKRASSSLLKHAKSYSNPTSRRHSYVDYLPLNIPPALQKSALLPCQSSPSSSSKRVFPEKTLKSFHEMSVKSNDAPASKTWRKLRNALIATSTAVNSASKRKASEEHNNAFLEYFSTQRHPSNPSFRQSKLAVYNSSPESTVCFPNSVKTSNSYRNFQIGRNSFDGKEQRVQTEPSLVKFMLMPENSSTNKTILDRQSSITEGLYNKISHDSDQFENEQHIEMPHMKASHTTFKDLLVYYTCKLFCCLPSLLHKSQTPDSCYENTSFSRKCHNNLRSQLMCNPQGQFIFVWLGVVAVAAVYNLWSAIMRQAFKEVQQEMAIYWIFLDGLADCIYLGDIMVQFRTCYLEKGLVVKNERKIAHRYVWSKPFILDTLALLPLDLIQPFIGIQPLVRVPRFLKCFRAWDWKVMVENRTTYPNAWRVVMLTHILFLGCHWFASFYFLLSELNGFDDPWGYPDPTSPELKSLSRKYLQSFYWATLTLTTIGDISAPSETVQYAFTTATYLIGVFVFATIVGQVGTIINNRNAARLSFEHILDNAKSYMSSHRVPKCLRNRVLRWYDYAWQRRQLFGENDLNSLGLLPDKLKTELALHVHLETLKKVTIFHECRPEFLHDLVLKMKSYIFTPGDLICRNGEVAREMFIIADGVLEVISKSGLILKRLEAGNYFGEIGILCMNAGANKRTADVRAVGYAELFVLSREDVLSALADHPEAHAIIVEHATKRLLESKTQEDAQGQFNNPSLNPSIAEMVCQTLHVADITTSVNQSNNYGIADDIKGLPRDSEDLKASEERIPGPSTSLQQNLPNLSQTIYESKTVLDNLERSAHDSVTSVTRNVSELTFLLKTYIEKFAERDERINNLLTENLDLKRKLRKLTAENAALHNSDWPMVMDS